MSKRGIIVKSVGGVFTVAQKDGAKTICYSPKKFRYKCEDVIIGDEVQFDCLKQGKGVITDVLPRKNTLNRPKIANVDACFVVIAAEPKPDFYLVDKVLINCFQQNIDPIIVVNKTDLGLDVVDEAQQNYSKVAQIVAVSALDDSVRQLERFFKDSNVVCFAGQSAVGKTSLLNAFLNRCVGEVGGLSAKSGRGMHTTRHASLHRIGNGYIADTCGFSLCDVNDVRSDELRLYLDDMVALSVNCKYSSCTHTVEEVCAVKQAVQNGTFNKNRYQRYVEEYNELVQKEKNRY